MNVDMATYGLKSKYTFKNTYIRTSRSRDDIHQKLRQIVAPAIRDLESRGLINGFHYLVHEHIDLRLSCADWDQHESKIKQVLKDHSIPTDLVDWEFKPEGCGGETGAVLSCNNLEFNSRLCLALLELINETDDQRIRQEQEKLCPHYWVHYLCNQFGYLNLNQVKFEFQDAFIWLNELVSEYPQLVPLVRTVLGQVKRIATELEQNLPIGQ